MLIRIIDMFGVRWAVNRTAIVALRDSPQLDQFDIYLEGGLRIQMKGTYDEMYQRLQEGLIRLRKEGRI